MKWLVTLVLASGCGRVGFTDVANDDGAGGIGDGAGGGDGVNPPALTNVMFVTSQQRIPTQLGLAGADTLCADSARAAGLSGTFVAWMSSSTSFARDRIGAARGWIRVDGRPFVDTLTDIASGHMLSAPSLDETGTPVPDMTYAFTGTGPDGVAVATCNDYTTGATYGTEGFAHSGMILWTNFLGFGCGTLHSYYCFQVDHQRAISLPSIQRYAFMTKELWLPNGGLAGADALCNANASAAGLPGNYLALLATPTATAASRFTIGAPWSRPDGVVVFTDFTSLLAPPLNTADGQMVASGGFYAWTGAATPRDVGTTASTCANWSQLGTGNGVSANLGTSDSLPWPNQTNGCSASGGELICLQQ